MSRSSTVDLWDKAISKWESWLVHCMLERSAAFKVSLQKSRYDKILFFKATLQFDHDVREYGSVTLRLDKIWDNADFMSNYVNLSMKIS